jgi:hypothetical protein
MQDDKHSRYLTGEELGAVLPAAGYAIVTPPGYAPMMGPPKFMATPITEVGGSRRVPMLLQLPTSPQNFLPKFLVLVILPFSKQRMPRWPTLR